MALGMMNHDRVYARFQELLSIWLQEVRLSCNNAIFLYWFYYQLSLAVKSNYMMRVKNVHYNFLFLFFGIELYLTSENKEVEIFKDLWD
jgi:hypothetical protein